MSVAPVLFLLFACSPLPDREPPPPGSFQAALHVLRTGNAETLRHELGKAEGLLLQAGDMQQQLDPETWLIFTGAVTRQHNLQAAADALNSGDAEALRDALGFSDQALHTDILNATHSVGVRRAADHNYYQNEAPAVHVLSTWLAPDLPANAMALHVSMNWCLERRHVRVHFGRNRHGITDLRAAYHQAGAVASPGTDAQVAHLPPELDQRFLQDQRIREATLRLLREDGSLLWVRLVREQGDWKQLEAGDQTLTERLENLRDSRLRRIRDAAQRHVIQHGRWPGSAVPLMLRAGDFTDPASPHARLGWAELDPTPPQGIEYRVAIEPSDIAAIALHNWPQGRRAIRRDGELVWQE